MDFSPTFNRQSQWNDTLLLNLETYSTLKLTSNHKTNH